jgi:hypothetical protein
MTSWVDPLGQETPMMAKEEPAMGLPADMAKPRQPKAPQTADGLRIYICLKDCNNQTLATERMEAVTLTKAGTLLFSVININKLPVSVSTLGSSQTPNQVALVFTDQPMQATL